ncbi:hypothetical protein COW46_01540 [Candidatus Gracilibacteria bacterium CG17_big_fil_post_rev_8_21_14_2_50_48_13]|nr:MAG: hypothetical protein COW46_01540 [Candidatus Gracilibacteria bacterium CG17_big_fil_post_rev_8_21_14_2_50_48_13]
MVNLVRASYAGPFFLSMPKHKQIEPKPAPYSVPMQLREPCSNNGLSYEERRRAGSTGILHVAARLEDPKLRLHEGELPAFEEVEEGTLMSFKGLAHFVSTRHPVTGAPITVVDNHNHALYFWCEAYVKGDIPLGLPLVHVDQHKDMRVPSVLLARERLTDLLFVHDYVNSEVHVGSFIVPALEAGLLSEVRMLDGDGAFEQFSLPKTPFVLDIDLDVFARDLAYMNRSRMREVLRALMGTASCITIATSPYFIPFDEAKAWLEILLEDAGIRR